jgi:hypothetical protein
MERSTEYPLKADQRKRLKLALDIHNVYLSVNSNHKTPSIVKMNLQFNYYHMIIKYKIFRFQQALLLFSLISLVNLPPLMWQKTKYIFDSSSNLKPNGIISKSAYT